MHNGLKILHLEDKPGDAELIERELKKTGFTFEKVVVDNRADFIKALNNFSPDVILSDHSLPSYNSNKALDDIKALNTNVPFILITATISEEFAVDIIKQGADDYILKDRLNRLPSAINNALEKKRLEKEKQNFLQAIIARESLMRDAEQMAHFGSFHVDIVKNIVTWSNECYRIYGYNIGETEPSLENFLLCIHPDDREFVNKTIFEGLANQYTVKINFRIKTKEEVKYIYCELASEKNEEGIIAFIKGFIHDITNIKQAEDLLHKSEANLRTIFDTTDTAYILFNPAQSIISFNGLAVVFTRELYNKELKEGLFAFDFFSEKRRYIINEAFETAVKGGNANYETKFFNRQGEEKWYNSRWLSIMGDKGVNLGVILAISDITERKMAELEREKIAGDLILRNNALEQFAFIVSHNLRAPVANIIGLSDALSNWEGAVEGKQHFLNAVSVSAKKLDDVVHDLNHILRISQRVNEQKQVVYFQQLVEEIKAMFGERITSDAVLIKTDFTEMINTSNLKSYLYNIFYDIILNSINFRQPFRPPVIEIKSHRLGTACQLIFTDNGKGIDLEKYGKKIFGMYQRFDTSVEGRGMGLCMVKTQVETLGGTIRVESELDKGASFIIELPC